MDKAVLRLKDIDLAYGTGEKKLVVLDKANLTLNQGETVALIAPSGTGKSSLLHIAGLLERGQGGVVEVCGRDCTKLNDNIRTAVRRNEIGFIYQFHHLLPEFTAIENIIVPQLVAGLSKKEARIRAMEVLGYLRVAHRAEHRPSELSGGEQQRVAIARAVANVPMVLLADEPTGNLDPDTASYVFDALSALVEQSGLSALIATHNHALAQKMHRRITLRDGKVVELP